MEFNTQVRTNLLPILIKYVFDIVYELNNLVQLQSSNIQINLAYNIFENSNYISIGKKDGTMYPINNKSLRVIFNSDLNIEEVRPEIFIQNLSVIFQQKESNEILKGNIGSFVDFKLEEIKDYNLMLMNKQTLEAASKAWRKSDYKEFIVIIDKSNIENLPQSYLLKYKIAKQKI